MNRRSLLKAIAAGSLTAANPLACLLARNAMAQNGSAHIRTIFLYHPNGAVGDWFFPPAGASALPAMSAPLQSVYNNLVFLDGIGYAGEANTHEGGAAKCLTGRHRENDPYSSIDILMGKEDWANRAMNGISVPSVQMGVGTWWGNDANKRISHDGNITIDSTCDPRIVYPRLFGATRSLPTGPNAGANTGGIEQRMLSAASNDLTRIQNQIGNVEGQRERLQQHAEALSILEAKFSGGGSDIGQACTVPDISAAPIFNKSDTDEDWTKTEILPYASDIQQDIAIAALSCGITRTIAFSYGVPVSPAKVPGSNAGDHDASHGDAAMHSRSKTWWMNEIASFIKKLEQTPDLNGSLLDNTIIVTVSDLGHGNNHDHYRIPMFLASGINNNVGLVTGRSLDFRTASAATSKVIGDGPQHPTINHTDVLDTIRQVAGYSSFDMPNKQGDIMRAWTGGNQPR